MNNEEDSDELWIEFLWYGRVCEPFVITGQERTVHAGKAYEKRKHFVAMLVRSKGCANS